MKKFTANDTFTFNHAFKSKLFRVKLTQVVQKETTEERSQTQSKIEEDRKFMIEVAFFRLSSFFFLFAVSFFHYRHSFSPFLSVLCFSSLVLTC